VSSAVSTQCCELVTNGQTDTSPQPRALCFALHMRRTVTKRANPSHLYPVYTIQPVVKPVVQPVWQPAVCTIQPVVKPIVKRVLQYQTGLTTGWMFVYTIQPVDNRFDNRLYRVNGALGNAAD